MAEQVALERTGRMGLGLRMRLSAMMFLQFMMFPVWFTTVIPYVRTLTGGENWAMALGMLMGFGMLASPIVGMFADRFVNAEKVLAASDFAYVAVMVGCFFVREPAVLFVLLLLAAVLCMPAWALSASVAMANTSTAEFPAVRVFGSLGWVCSAVFSLAGVKCFGLDSFDKSPWIFASGAFAGLFAGIVALVQPPTPPAAKGQPMSVADALGLRAFVLFRDRRFAAFTLVLSLSMIPFQWYMGYNALYLDESGFKYLVVTQNLGQLGELGFMLVVPLIVKRYGYRWAMVIGMAALTLRYAFFSLSAATGCHVFDFGGILIHGLIFALLLIGAQMYVEDHAPAELRNQAQGMILLMTTCLGAFASVFVFDLILKANLLPDGHHSWLMPFLVAFGMSLAVAVAMALLPDDRRKV